MCAATLRVASPCRREPCRAVCVQTLKAYHGEGSDVFFGVVRVTHAVAAVRALLWWSGWRDNVCVSPPARTSRMSSPGR